VIIKQQKVAEPHNEKMAVLCFVCIIFAFFSLSAVRGTFVQHKFDSYSKNLCVLHDYHCGCTLTTHGWM
jgi:hypothetical protein